MLTDGSKRQLKFIVIITPHKLFRSATSGTGLDPQRIDDAVSRLGDRYFVRSGARDDLRLIVNQNVKQGAPM